MAHSGRNSIADKAVFLAAALSIFSASASAHEGHAEAEGSIMNAILHWFTMPDHLLMLGLGVAVAYTSARKLTRKSK